MSWEYLLFNFCVFAFPFGLSFFRPTYFLHRWSQAFLALLLVGIPYLVWDALVVGKHWSFHPDYVTGSHWGSLPLEEILFFLTVPFACLFAWEMLFAPRSSKRLQALSKVYWLLFCMVPLGLVLFFQGKEYTGLMLLSLGLAAMLDKWMNFQFLLQPRFYLFMGFVLLCTLPFNGYLTWRPVVLYDPAYQLNIRLGTIPIEDFGYGLSLIFFNLLLFEKFKAQKQTKGSWLARWIEGRFGGYRHQMNQLDETRPKQLKGHKKVAVVGAGLAGMSAAAQLAERGFSVTLLEKNSYLGGKVGSWPVELEGGQQVYVEHGFHAFFHNYYNLRRFLEKLDVARHLTPIDDYLVLGEDGTQFRFRDINPTPVLNLLSMASKGVYRFRDVMFPPTGQMMGSFLRYKEEETYAKYDNMSFEEFAQKAKLPSNLRLVFNSFARAFFSEPERMSMAELIKSFHYYYLSNDCGLLYEYFDDDVHYTLLEPWRKYLVDHGVQIQLNQSLDTISKQGEQFLLNGELYDYAILATDIVGTQAIVKNAEYFQEHHATFATQIEKQQRSQAYSVLRIWTDRDIDPSFSPFLITERRQILDSVSTYHRLEKESRAWVAEHGGGIFELHSYALPDDLRDEAAIKRQLMEDFVAFFPEMAGCAIRHEYFQCRQDFTAFHVGLHQDRPGFETSVDGLYLAGDWVKIPHPAMLMEAAYTSGLWCANAILEKEECCQEPIFSVPLEGIMANMPGE